MIGLTIDEPAKVLFTHRLKRYLEFQAYKQGMYGPKYVWVFPGWYDDKWWRTMPEERGDCTDEQMDAVAEGYFAAGDVTLNPTGERR